jgi:hypothetical protein
MVAAMGKMAHRGRWWIGLVAVVGIGVLGVLGSRSFGRPDLRPETVPGPVYDLPHETKIRPGHPAPAVAIGLNTYHGTPVDLRCATCHAVKTPNRERIEASTLRDFHVGLDFAHGSMSCLNCHNEDNYDTLRLANGTALPFERVMELCQQCHGPQARDYRNGSHGGMNGYWDLASGPRERNTCVDCHHPHQPAYPKVSPVFKPRDGLPTHGQEPSPHHESDSH